MEDTLEKSQELNKEAIEGFAIVFPSAVLLHVY